MRADAATVERVLREARSVAAVDRVVHHTTILHTHGDSYRLRDAKR